MTELNRELEDRELKTTGKEAKLSEWLKQAKESDSLDPETFLFLDDMSSTISISSDKKNEISLENKIFDKYLFCGK